jgi:Disulphide bond corrector protein DsbC
MTHRLVHFAALTVLLVGSATAEPTSAKSPSVTLAPPPVVSIERGKAGAVTLNFRVSRGFHVNSNTPKSEYLIPTAVKFELPTDIVLGKVAYPEGQDMSFPFAPDEKLNVYTGDFSIDLLIRPLHTVVPGKYALHGKLRYQACDNAQCYPPKQLPVDLEVKVLKGPPPPVKNPAQSPHAHR